MLLPINTDAPIYHFPWVTLSLIAANIVAFAAWISAGAPDEWTLVYGDGLHPVQWISSVFLHGGIFHLIGNMFFLWGFGLVVEGKLGWWRYLTVYLGIAVVSCFLEQLMMLGFEGSGDGLLGEGAYGSPGASGVIFGLMMMSLVWAPKNDMTLFMLFFYQPIVFDAPILAFCGFYLGMESLFFALSGFSVGSALLHLIGATVGLIVGVAMLKWDWVDCEGWDIFNVMRNTHGRQPGQDEYFYRDASYQAQKIATPTEAKNDRHAEKVGSKTLDPRQRIRKFLDAGDVISALGEYDKLVAFHPTWRLDCQTHGDLAEAAYRDKSYDDALPLLKQYLERFPEENPEACTRIRVKYAKLLIDVAKRPREGLAVLGSLDPDLLSPKINDACRQLQKRAETAIQTRQSRSKS